MVVKEDRESHEDGEASQTAQEDLVEVVVHELRLRPQRTSTVHDVRVAGEKHVEDFFSDVVQCGPFEHRDEDEADDRDEVAQQHGRGEALVRFFLIEKPVSLVQIFC